MAYEESFAPEPAEEVAAPAAAAAAATEGAPATAAAAGDAATTEDPAASVETTTATADEAAAEGDGAQGQEGEEGAGATTTETEPAPAFVEADYLKAQFGDDAPKTGAELKQRLADLQAKQITPAQQAQLAMFSDPAKLAEFAAKVATKDYDKPEAIDIMRERFAQQHPDMSEGARERRFQRQFADKYPTLADAIANPANYDGTEADLLAEKEDADYDAKADRAALKAAQDERIKQHIASVAPPTPQVQFTPEQQADMMALPKWLDEAYKDGATIAVDAGDGTKLELPIVNAASFKAAFNDTYSLIDALTLTKPLAEGGVLDKENQALLTAFLMDPKAFVKNIAVAARKGMPEPEAAISVATLNNSSKTRPGAKPAAAAASENTQPSYLDQDAWLKNSNI